ncbi:MAG: hypothetical protein IT374_22175 [Polyangiaceae bacterium]|nr:hypothetical protein [Polyangiaceae bacterium]
MRARAAAVAWLLAPQAWALAPAAPGTSVELDVAIVVHDAAAGEQHLFVGARARAPGAGPIALVASVPRGARLADPLPGAPAAILSLASDAKVPALPASPLTARVERDLSTACAELAVTCAPQALSWASAARDRESLVVRLSGDGDARVGAWAHLVVPTSTPFAPFAAPALEETDRRELVAPDDGHPPRVKLWLELGVETRAGAWERAMDRALAETEPRLARCYREVADKLPKLSGDLHVQLRLPPGGAPATAEGERASHKALGKVARCYARELERVEWPASSSLRPVPLEVHALVKPPIARLRAAWFVVLASTDVEPRLGDDLGGAVPDARVVVSREPEARELESLPADVRAALSLAPARRYRLVVVETRADARPARDDVRFRALASPPPPRAGEPDWPIVAPGDRPSRAPVARPRWRPSRRARILLGLGAGLAVCLGVAWLALREPRRS